MSYENVTSVELAQSIIRNKRAMKAAKGSAEVSEYYMPMIDELERELERRQQDELNAMLDGMTEAEKAVCMKFYRVGNAHGLMCP